MDDMIRLGSDKNIKVAISEMLDMREYVVRTCERECEGRILSPG